MPTFLFGLLSIPLLVPWPVKKFHLDSRSSSPSGCTPGQSGFNLDYIRHLALPVAALTVQSVAVWSRFERASMLDILNADYVRTARAKGVPQRKVIFKHAFRNALIPLVTVVALDSAFLVGGLVITEQIFSIAGMGRLFLESLQFGDAPVLLGWFLVVAALRDHLQPARRPPVRRARSRGSGSRDHSPLRSARSSTPELELPPGEFEPASRRVRTGSCSGAGSSGTSSRSWACPAGVR